MTRYLNLSFLGIVVVLAIMDYQSRGVHDVRFSMFLLLFVLNYVGAKYWEHCFRDEYRKEKRILKQSESDYTFCLDDLFLWFYWFRYLGLGLMYFQILLYDTITEAFHDEEMDQ